MYQAKIFTYTSILYLPCIQLFQLIKVVGSFEAYKTRPKGSVGSCKSVLVLRLSAVGQKLLIF